MHGLPIARLAVNEPPYILPGTRPLPPPELAGQLTLLAQVDDREAMVELFLRDEVGVPAAAIKQMQAQPAWKSMIAMAPSVLHDARLLGRHEVPSGRLSRIGIPTIVFGGGASFPWLLATARAVADFIPRAEFRLLPDQPHSPAPHVLCPELVSFFRA